MTLPKSFYSTTNENNGSAAVSSIFLKHVSNKTFMRTEFLQTSNEQTNVPFPLQLGKDLGAKTITIDTVKKSGRFSTQEMRAVMKLKLGCIQLFQFIDQEKK